LKLGFNLGTESETNHPLNEICTLGIYT